MSTSDAIKKLHTSMIDTRRAYEKAAGETADASLKSFFQSMITLRQTEHDSLHRALTEMGEKPDEDGSFMTTVHRAAIGIRASVTGIDRGALSAFASGEENILQEYDEALSQHDLHPETSELLRRQRSKLVDKIAAMKAMSSGQQ